MANIGTCSDLQTLVDTAFCTSFTVLRLEIVKQDGGLHKLNAVQLKVCCNFITILSICIVLVAWFKASNLMLVDVYTIVLYWLD